MRRTLQAGELAPIADTQPTTSAQQALLEERKLEWRERRSESVAVEFLATAMLLGVPDEASDAKEFLRENASTPSTLRIATLDQTSEGAHTGEHAPPWSLHDIPKERIRKLRSDLDRRSP